MPVQIQGKKFGLPRSQGRLKMSDPVPQSKDFIFTTVLTTSSSLTNNALPQGISGIPFYLTAVSCGCVYVLTASPTIVRTADVYFEFAFNAGDVAGRQPSRWFHDSGSSTTEQHVRGVCGAQIDFPVPIFVPPSSNVFIRLDANGVDPGVATQSVEISIQIYGRFV